MTPRKLLIIVLVFPWLVLGALLVTKFIERASGQVWLLPVEGYDPRNLIYGHYARVRINWPNVQIRPDLDATQKHCLCLEAENPKAQLLTPKAATFQACESITPTCTGIVRMTSDDLTRGYEIFLSEKDGPVVDDLLRQDAYRGRITVKSFVSPEGVVTFDDLHIDSIPLHQRSKHNLHE